MADTGDTGATRSRLLELKEEQRLVREGYEFLDEKRILLAAEILSQLDRYLRLYRQYEEQHTTAVQALRLAVSRHGLDELTVYPATILRDLELETRTSRFLGVALTRVSLSFQRDPTVALNPSPEARHCGASFASLLPLAAELAALSRNLHRLNAEYSRTDRRARALDNVLLPEIAAEIKSLEEQLEVIDQEDAVRARLYARGRLLSRD